VRPLRLEAKGFTAFREPVELDFTWLDVFAISGPTGSGKSSLLDAMTYALYGRVERVGDRVSQLISQGQPRMAVAFEFAVAQDRYRVTRSTSARGTTKIQLERQTDGGWRQAGEGSDRVRDAERMIARTIGMTYDGFTRSVLLPQGKFAEFLVGEAKKRREILIELLGLSLFRSMAERAGAIAKESSVRVQTMKDMLEREYGDATTEALKEARAAVRSAKKRHTALDAAARMVTEVRARSEGSTRSVDELRACADEAMHAAEVAAASRGELQTLARRLQASASAVERHAAAAAQAEGALTGARTALVDGSATMGSAKDLAMAHGRAQALAETARARDAKARLEAEAANGARALARAVAEAERALAGRHGALAARQADLSNAESVVEDARHDDLVATVAIGLKAGDPCPVCGASLQRAPTRTAGGVVERATKGLAKARTALDRASKDVAEAERAAEAARRDADANAAERARLDAEIQEHDRAMSAHRAVLCSVLGEPLPSDPAAAIEERLDDLQRLGRDERDAARAAGEAVRGLLEAEQELERTQALIERHRDRLSADHGPLLNHIARAVGTTASSMGLPPPPAGSAPETLQEFAGGLARSLAALAARLQREVEERSAVQARLLDEANRRVAGLVEPADAIDTLAGAVDAACRTATADVATAMQRAADVAERLDRKKRFGEEVCVLEDRTRLFRALALELRADRLIAFLQEEALQVLAAAGSKRLAEVSEGRYRLVCRDDEFFVVDTWNGDEERSVRTLSGGETFLASLALALALADQVRSLSVTDRARLDSLFLDEGFGTLDQESLAVVVDAIEQLAGAGRMVGVITHVRELAEQFPRLEVEKSPRGSRVRLVR
jgi:exonuclease SbcC